MMSLEPPKVNVREIAPVDFTNRQHRGFIFDLALANQSRLLNDYDTDILVLMNDHQQLIEMGGAVGFIALNDERPVGYFWLEFDRYDTGRIDGAFTNVWDAFYFLKWLLSHSFDTLGLRKVDTEIPFYHKTQRGQKAYQKLLRRIGFRKRAILPEAVVTDGQPKGAVLLDFLRKDYHG